MKNLLEMRTGRDESFEVTISDVLNTNIRNSRKMNENREKKNMK